MELKDLRVLSGLKECGPMAAPMSPPTPASVSMTAASGSELSGMLKDIMSLAGLQKVEPHHLGVEPAPMKLLPEPVKAVGPAASDGEVMRGIADKLNLDKDEEEEKKADEAWDNTPEDPRTPPAFDAEKFANHENPPGAGKGRRTMQPNATVEEVAEQLFAEYQNFLAEDSEEELEELRNPDSKIKPGSVRDINRQRMAAAMKGPAHKSGGQPSHSGAPAKTSKGDIKAQAADVKAHTGKSEYRGKLDDIGAEYEESISEEQNGLTDKQKQQLLSIAKKYKNVPGNAHSTLIGGYIEMMVNSGIYSDSLSEKDAERLSAAGMLDWDNDSDDYEGLDQLGLNGANDLVKKRDGGPDLDVIKLENEIVAVVGNNTEEASLYLADVLGGTL